MATPIPKKRYKAKYKCTVCGETWTAKDTSHLNMICINSNCKTFTRVDKFEVIDKLVIYGCKECANMIKKQKKCSSEVHKDVPCCPICLNEMIVLEVKDLWEKKRKFGHFHCNGCRNEWKSGNAWEGVGQQCRKCKVEILPYHLDPLHRFNPDEIIYSKSEPHRQDLCDMCKELGYNCENYDPPNDNVASPDEIPEDTGTDISDNSSIDDRDLDDGGHRTPVNYSNEDIKVPNISNNDQVLEHYFGNLKLEPK